MFLVEKRTQSPMKNPDLKGYKGTKRKEKVFLSDEANTPNIILSSWSGYNFLKNSFVLIYHRPNIKPVCQSAAGLAGILKGLAI